MRSSILAIGLVALLFTLLLSGAQAHTGEDGPLGVSGSFMLDGTPSLGDTFHAPLADLGIPGHAGETLRYFWSANNGSGPAVYFEVHDHAPPAGFRIHYNYTGITESREWVIPGSEAYVVLWRNLNAEPIEVQYALSLLGAPPDYTLTIVVLAAVGGLFAVLWFVWRRKPTPKDEEPTANQQSEREG